MTERDETAGSTTVRDEVQRIVDDASARPDPGKAIAGRETLDREEQLIKDSVLRMGMQVEEAISRAAKSLRDHDAELALQVIVADPAINQAQREASQLIVATIATQQPVARDLRYLLTLDHVTYELERIGDHAASVAKQVLKLASEPPLEGHLHLPEMADRGMALIHGVLRALVDVDAVAAREVAAQDDDIDDLYHATFDRVVELMRADPDNIERGARIIIAAHYLERIGDRSTNIAEDIVYLDTGDVEDLNP
jgi:phosphate transport system protein